MLERVKGKEEGEKKQINNKLRREINGSKMPRIAGGDICQKLVDE